MKTKPLHAPDEPIPAEIEARMTKPIEAPALFQVWVERTDRKQPLPIGPRLAGSSGLEVCERLVQAINAQISLGKERRWGNPHVVRYA